MVATDRFPPIALVLTSMVLFQFGTALSATVLDRLGPSATCFIRLSIAGLALCVLARHRLRGLGRADVRLLLAFGAVLAAINLSLYEGLQRVPLGIAVTIQFLGPLGVAVAESRRRSHFAWVLLAAAGVVLLARPGSPAAIDPLGLAFTLMAAASWAAYIVMAQRIGQRFEGTEGIAVAMSVAALITLVPALATGVPTAALDAGTVGRCVAAGLLLVVPYTLEIAALQRIPRRVFGVLMSGEPAVAALAGLLVLGQGLGASDVFAIALIVAASAGALWTAAPATMAG